MEQQAQSVTIQTQNMSQMSTINSKQLYSKGNNAFCRNPLKIQPDNCSQTIISTYINSKIASHSLNENIVGIKQDKIHSSEHLTSQLFEDLESQQN